MNFREQQRFFVMVFKYKYLMRVRITTSQRSRSVGYKALQKLMEVFAMACAARTDKAEKELWRKL